MNLANKTSILPKIFINNFLIKQININNVKSVVNCSTVVPQQTAHSLESKNSERFTGYIPLKQLQITYSRSSAPGGQNVNCVDTKVDLRFHVSSANWIADTTRQKLLSQFSGKITKDGYFVLKNDQTRHQHINLAACLEKLRNIIRSIEEARDVTPSAETVAKHETRQKIADHFRIKLKKERSFIKNLRRANIEL